MPGFPQLMVFPSEPGEWTVWAMGRDAFGGGPVLVFFVFHSAAERLAAPPSWHRRLGPLGARHARRGDRPAIPSAAVAVSSWAADPWTGGAYTHIPPGASPPTPTCSASRSADGSCSRASTRKARGSPTPTAR